MARSNERKAQLLTIMRAHRERATCRSEFSRTAIAHEAGVTPQYLSMLIWPEFHAEAQGLPGVRWTAETTLRKRWRTTAIAPRAGAGAAATQRPNPAEH
jgi:hypothetical protein